MRKSAPASKRRLRGARLLWTTGLAGSLFGGAGHALAQSFPGFGTVDSTAVSAIVGDTAPTISSTATDLSVTLNAKSTVINWQDFNIPVATTADFNSARTDQITVLNRVIGNGGPPTLSQIDGILSASNTGLNNIALFLVNPSGIMFGADGSYSGGSFVLSTLDISPTDFNDLDTNYRAFGGATGALSLLNGAGGINVTDGSFVAIGEAVSIDKSVIATGGDVALVAASDIDFSLQASSPISIKVNAGTALGTATIGSNGQLTGSSVMFAGASTAVASLLNVDAGASLTATDVNGRVIISAGKGSDVAANFPTQASVSYDAGLTASTDNATFAGVVSGQEFVAKTSGDFIATSALAVTGNLTVMTGGITSLSDSVSAGADLTIIGNSVLLGDGAGSDLYQVGGDVSVTAGAGGIQVASSWQLGTVPLIGTVAFDGGVTAAQDFIINTTNAASVSGNVVAARDYSVTGGTVLLGNMATAVSQTSGGYLSISATAGGVTANAPTGAGITLNSDMDITGAETLSINATGGAINLGAASTLIGGSVGGARANVAAIAVSGATSVGAVYADQFQTGSMADFTAGGTIDTLQSLAISTTGAISVKGINVGNAGASVSVISTGIGKDVTVDGAIAGPNVGGFSGASDVIVQAGTTATGGKATITGNVGSRGGLQVDGATVELGNAGAPVQFATGVVSISAGSGGVTGLGALTLQSDADGTAVPGSMTDRLQIVSDGPVSLGVASRLIGGAAPSGAADQRQALVMVDAPTASVSIGQVDAFGLHIDSTAGTASITGSVSLLGNLDVAGATINLGDDVGSDLFTIGGDVFVAAGLGGTQIAANWSLATVPGAVSFDGAVTSESAFSLEAIGAVSVDAVTANAGSIALRSDGSFVTASGALLATADISVFAATGAEVQSDVSAGGNYSVSGQAISLGNAGASNQSAAGELSLIAGAGGLNGLGTLTLQSDSDGSAVPGSMTDRLQIDSGGTVSLTPASRLIGGITPVGLTDQRQSHVVVNAPTASVALGQVDAFSLHLDASAGIANLFAPVSVLGDLTVSGATVNLGDNAGADLFKIGSGISVSAGAGGIHIASNWALAASPLTGPATFDGTVTSDTSFIINTSGPISVDDVITNGAGLDISLVSTASTVSVGSLTTSRSVLVDAADVATVAGNVSVSENTGGYTVNGDSVILGTIGQNVSQAAAGAISITARNNSADGSVLGLGTVGLEANTDGTGTEGLTLTSINGGVALGPLSSLRASRAVGNGSAVTVSGASGKPISFGSASADIVQLLASGNVTAGGAVESNQAFALATPGVIDVRGVKVSDPLAGISLTSTGAGVMTAGSLEAPSDIVVSASSAAQILGGVSAGGNYLASGNSVILSGGAQIANGSVSITAGAGGVSSSGSLALTANADSTPTLGESLDIISAGDVNLASATLFGGTARQSNVSITATAANAVSFNSAEANALLVNAPTATIVSAGTIRTTDALSLITSQAISLGTVETTGAVAAVVLNSGSGDVTIGGNLTATGDVLIFSGADIRSLDMTSLTGSISLTATDSVLGLSEPEAMPVGAGGNRVDSVTAGGQLSIVANQSDVRARTIFSATGNVDLTVAGSLTGLATSDPGNVIAGPTLTTNAPGAGVTIQAANIVRLKDVQSAGSVSINQSGTGGVAIASIVATGSDVSVAAGASGFFLGTVNTGAASGVVSLTSGLVTAPLAAPQYVAAPATLIDAGFGRTTVSAASSAQIGGASGLLRQLGDVTAGSGAISISGQSISASTLTANNATGGTIGVTANGGGLYLDAASAGVGLTLNKIGGTAATTGLLGDEIRVAGALTSQNAGVSLVSDTNVRLANVMAPNGNIILAAKTGTLNLTNAMAGYSVALQSGTDMVVLDITANEDLGLQSGGTLSANNLSAGDDVVATVVGTATIAGINPAGNAVSPTNVDLRHIVFGGASPLIIAGEDVQLGRRNAVIDSGGDLAITAANAADSMAVRSGGVLTLGTASAGEDFAARATGNATLFSVTAGDDLDIVSTGGNVSLTLGTSLASGDDTRRLDLSGTGIILANVETLAGGNVITDAATVLTLGDVRAVGAPNAGSIIGRAGAAIMGTFLSASADVSLQGAGNVTLTKALAGDDIELTSTGGNVRLDEGSAASGSNDSTRADFSSSVLGIVAVEDHGGHNIFVDALNNVSLGTGSTTVAAQASIAARASTGSVTGSIVTAGEDIATQSGGATMLEMVQAGDDIDVTSVGAVDLTIATTTGTGGDLRRADFSNASRIGLGAETLGRSNVSVVTDGNATLGTVSAAASIGILAKGTASAINSTSLTASEDVALKSTLGTVAALISAGDDVSVASGTVADLDSVTSRGGGADDRDVIFGTGAGFSAAADAGGSDISVSGQSADIVFASANRDLSVSTSADTLSLTDGVAGRLATLAKTGVSGDLRISGNLNAGSSITIGSTSDVLLGSGKTVASTAGSIGLTATKSVFGLAGLSMAPAISEIGTLTTTGNITVTGIGDVRAVRLAAGGALDLNIGGSLTGTGVGAAVSPVVGGNLSAAAAGQSVAVMAGNGVGSVAYLDTIIAGGDVSLSANSIAFNGATAGGALNLAAGNGLNFVAANAGSANLFISGTPLPLPPLFAASDTLDARFGAADLSAGSTLTVTVASGLAQIGSANAGGNIGINGIALSVNNATSANAALAMTATGGALYLGDGSAGLGVSLTKSSGTDSNDELRVRRTVSGATGVAISSDTNARLGSVSSSAGNVSVQSRAITSGLGGGRAILSATGVGKSVSVNAGSTALLDTVTAGKDISLSAADAVDVTSAAAAMGNLVATAGSVLAGAVSTGGSIGLTATNGQLTLGTGTAGTTATLTKNGVTGELQVTNALISGGDATIVSGASARLATISATAGAVSIISAQDTTGLAGPTAGTSDAGFGRADLSAGTGKSITVTSGSLAQLGAIGAGQNILVLSGNTGRNGAVDVATAIATAGSLTLAARAVAPADTINDGDVLLGAGSAGTSALLTNTENAGAAGNILVASALTAGTSATVSSAASVTGGTIDANGGDTIITAAPLVELQVAEASGRVSATAGSVLIGRATSGGALMLTASSGQLTLGTGTAGTTATLAKTGATGELQVTTGLASGTDTTINSSTNARLASVSATGGFVAVNSAQATTGVSGGRANLAANAVGKSVSVNAGTLALTGAVTAGKDVSLTASNLVDAASTVSASGNVQATAASVLAGTVSSGGAFALTANSDQLTLGTGSAGTSATLVKSGNVGDLQVSNSLVANGKVAIDSATNAGLRTIQSVADNIDVNSAQIALTGAVSVSADKTVTLANRKDISGNKTVLGDAAANVSDFVLTDTELDLIAAPNLVISSDIKNVAVGALSLKAATGAKTLKLLSTNASNISLSGVISEEAAANRTLQIGGTQTASPALTPTIASENELAATIFATATADAGGRILLPNANVELRATKVIFGLGGGGAPGGLIEQAANLSSEEVASQLVSRPDSVLYNPIPGYTQSDAGRTILSATTLTIRYTKFALFQNTAPAGLTGGILLQRPGAAAGPSGQPRLVLFSTSETPKNSVGLFGIIDGVTGNAAALLTTEIDTGNGTRITRSSSRLNGCAIGSPEQGCLTTQSPPPQLRLFDERQALVFRTADDSVLPFDPLVSTNNESLFIDFGGVSLPYDDAECAAGATSGACPQPGDKK